MFDDERDYLNFLDRMGHILKESSTACFAWALMPNHVHLLLSGADIARRLQITPSAVSKLVARGRGETMLPEMGEKIFEK